MLFNVIWTPPPTPVASCDSNSHTSRFVVMVPLPGGAKSAQWLNMELQAHLHLIKLSGIYQAEFTPKRHGGH